MNFRKIVATVLSLAGLFTSFQLALAAGPLTASCVGVPSTNSITWNASTTGGVLPVSFLWGNSATGLSQTLSVSPGTYSMNIQATDASSTVATSTCTSTVLQPGPSIVSFTASPASITAGQSAVLSWSVLNASSTTLNQGIGLVSSTSVTVSPTVTTTYELVATSPVSSAVGHATVSVTIPAGNPSTQDQIQNLLNQIAALKKQLMELLKTQLPPPQGGDATSTLPTVSDDHGKRCFEFKRDLKRGDRGDDVKELQMNLSDDSDEFSNAFATGFFGPKTEEALRKFQRKNAIVSGTTASTTIVFGSRTRNFLHGKHCISGTASSTSNDNHNERNDHKKETKEHKEKHEGRNDD